MSNNKYNDITCVNQVIACLLENPTLLDEERFKINTDDFPTKFHKLTFGVINNLYKQGVKSFSLEIINDYLAERPKLLGEYKLNQGDLYIQACFDNVQPAAFEYNYARFKKFSLLRAFDDMGVNLDKYYEGGIILDAKKKQEQEAWLDNISIEDITNLIADRVDEIKSEYVDDFKQESVSVSKGLSQLVENLKQSPEYGYPLPGKYINTVMRGARLGKFYLRSASTGTGKTRSMIADCCYIGCSHKYDKDSQEWIDIGEPQSCLYISTEQDLSEIQTLVLCYISQVNEAKILDSDYTDEEWERVQKAIEIIEKSKIEFISLPDFTLKQVEDTIKKGIRENNARYVFFDYIHSSMGILNEITQRSGRVALREDSILFLMSIKIKDIAVQYNVFVESATQLNGTYQDAEVLDQNALRGAKSIADKIDTGAIMVEVTEKDKELIAPICSQLGIHVDSINVKMSLYKNRRGAWKGVYLWMRADRGICEFEPMFITNYAMKLQEITDVKLKTTIEEVDDGWSF